jgi:hypothetical protein
MSTDGEIKNKVGDFEENYHKYFLSAKFFQKKILIKVKKN